MLETGDQVRVDLEKPLVQVVADPLEQQRLGGQRCVLKRLQLLVATHPHGQVREAHFARVPAVQGELDVFLEPPGPVDRKSTRLNSSHVAISYADLCLKQRAPAGPEGGGE